MQALACHPAPPPRAIVAVALLASAALGLQVALTRHFSFLYWHHFAFMIIGIGMLGFGAAGAWLARRGGVAGPEDALRLAGRGAFGSSVAIAFYLLVGPAVSFAPLAVLDDASQVVRLLAIYLLVLPPFAGLGLALGALLAGYRAHAHRVYGADLLGAGVGCLATVGLLGVLPAPTVLLAFGVVAAAGGALLAGGGAPSRRVAAWAWVAVLLALAAAGWAERRPFRPAPSKDIAGALGAAAGAEALEYSVSSATLRLDVTRPLSMPFYFGGDVAWPTDRPIPHVPTRLVFQDGSAPTVLVDVPDPAAPDFLGRTSQGLAYRIREAPRVCVIGAGGGPDLLIALHEGARAVTAVELNPQMLALGRERYREFTGDLFQRPEITPVLAEGRHFLARSDEHFDVIQMSGVDTFAALASGAYAMSENYLYTVEAGRALLGRLTPDGLVTVSRWILDPPRETLRLTEVFAEALRREGVTDPAAHLFVIRGRDWGTTLVSRRPFTAGELSTLRAWATGLGWSVALDPDGSGERPFVELIHGSPAERAAFLHDYPYDVSAPTDDRPFFFQFYRWGRLWNAPPSAGGYVITRLPVGYAVLIASLAQMLLLSLVFVLAPLWSARSGLRGQPRRAARLAFFVAIGAGYMGVEITSIQIFTVFLGAPVLSMAVTLAALLLTTGAGALWAGRGVRPPRAVVRNSVVAIAIWIVVSVLLLRELLEWTIAGPLVLRGLVVAAWLAPVGFALGAPLPTAVRALEREAPALVPWAWGANACASVAASLGVVLLSMQIGFRGTLLGAAGAYVLGYLAWRRTVAA